MICTSLHLYIICTSNTKKVMVRCTGAYHQKKSTGIAANKVGKCEEQWYAVEIALQCISMHTTIQITTSIRLMFVFTGSIARSATRHYLSYSEADFEVFRHAGATHCTDGVKFRTKKGTKGQRSHPRCQISPPSVQR